MANIRKRGNSWYAQVRRNGVTENNSFPIGAYGNSKDPSAAAKADAELWASQIESNILAEKHNKVPNIKFREVLIRYRDEVTPTKRSCAGETKKISVFLKDPIADVSLHDLNTTHFGQWRDRRLSTVSPASVLRDWNVLSAVCRRARDEWKWMTINPFKGLDKPKEPKARDRIPTEKELETLEFCGGYYRDRPITTKTAMAITAFLFSCETTMRAGELCALKWHEVFMDRGFLHVSGIEEGAMKNESAIRDIPLTARAKEILRQIQLTHSEGSVFQLNTASLDALFRKVKNRAAIKNLHYHDSRHVAVTMLSKHYDVLALGKIVGHKDIQELRTYYNPTIDDLVKHAP